MRQMVLDIRPDAPPRLDNFIPGSNIELLAALHETILGGAHLYLWGPVGSGRSHLLRAAVTAATEAGRPANYLRADLAFDAVPQTSGMLAAIDDIDAFPEHAQIAVFNAFNRARESNQTLLLAGTCPPRGLALREDLRTRIGQCLIYEVKPLDDRTRAEILSTLAERRGLRLGDDVVQFLLRHGRRDLTTLVAVLDALDQASLERKRPVTLPLLRELIQTGMEI